MEHKLVPRSIYFWGDNSELELARRLAFDEAGADKRRKGLVRDATAYNVIEVEPCDRVVILSSVPPWTADRVTAAYGRLVPIERREREIDETDVAGDTQPVLPELVDISGVTMPQLRRLTNRQLRDLAVRANVDLGGSQAERDRMSIINAILEASERRQLAASR